MKTVDELVSEIDAEIDALLVPVGEVKAESVLSDMILALVLKQLLRRLSSAQRRDALASVTTLAELIEVFEATNPDKDLSKVKEIVAILKSALS